MKTPKCNRRKDAMVISHRKLTLENPKRVKVVNINFKNLKL